MDDEIEAQHHRVADLTNALERLVAVPSDVSLVRDLVSASPPRSFERGLEALRPTCDTTPSHRYALSPTANEGRKAHSVVPGGQRSGTPKPKRRVRQGIANDVDMVHPFSSPDCLPSALVTSPPYRPSFYSAQFRAVTRESVTPSKLQFEDGCLRRPDQVNAGNGATLATGPSRPRNTGTPIDKKEVAECRTLLLRQREEYRALEELRGQLRVEAQRLTQLAERVRSEHVQVQRRTQACAIRERAVTQREREVETTTAQWKITIAKTKQHHANSIRVASAVNRQLHHELSRYTTTDDATRSNLYDDDTHLS
jgi:hypothetical protein